MPPHRRLPVRPTDIKRSTLAAGKDWNKPTQNRNHVFLFDGTWNDETGADPLNFFWDKLRKLWVSRDDPEKAYPPIVTNVVKTHWALGDDSDRQITHYFRGVGNNDENDFINAALEGAAPHEETLIRNAAYCRFLAEYRKGDRISILGFSRGAASARLFAQDLRTRGLLDEIMIESRRANVKNSGTTRQEVWAMFTHKSKKLIAGADIPIAFLGLWDTVATGMVVKQNSWTVPDDVGHVVHCLALDEERVAFKPILLDYSKAAAPRVKEVWFPGVHSDVGGGYFYDALGRVTLSFVWNNWNETLAAQELPPLDWKKPQVQALTDLTQRTWIRHSENDSLTAKLGLAPRRCKAAAHHSRPRVHPLVEKLVQDDDLFYCDEGACETFPPVCDPRAVIYEPEAYPGAAAVEHYDKTEWPA